MSNFVVSAQIHNLVCCLFVASRETVSPMNDNDGIRAW